MNCEGASRILKKAWEQNLPCVAINGEIDAILSARIE
jgi:hypothetical protein